MVEETFFVSDTQQLLCSGVGRSRKVVRPNRCASTGYSHQQNIMPGMAPEDSLLCKCFCSKIDTHS